jgi:DNA-binding Xre family transcriptional regulator
MLNFNIEKLLKKKKKTKYWLCQNMNITNRNLNRIINGETTSISFKYLDCNLSELISIDNDTKNIS